ncbi:hypothetical protein [Halovenus salina]|uniref:SpoIIAA-like n=1 Tax=Halovenus salina TaxID=1510225 RepID=A0ABD5VUU2_9EURY|nr:hypothetical protein [Halovenus salina]
MTRVIEETETYRIEVDQDIDTVIYTWTKPVSGEELRQGANALLAFAADNDLFKMIIDSNRIEAHTKADRTWLQEEWAPDIIDAGMMYSGVVYPGTLIAEMDIEQLMDGMDDSEHRSYITESLPEAREWIAEK